MREEKDKDLQPSIDLLVSEKKIFRFSFAGSLTYVVVSVCYFRIKIT